MHMAKAPSLSEVENPFPTTNKALSLNEIADPFPERTTTLDVKIKSELAKLRKKCQHPLSKRLPENPATNKSDYTAYLNEYGSSRHPSKEDKTDLLKTGNVNIGWKLHLNVKPENVVEVSKYLVDNGYRHKYLSGGDIEEGKVFTVYVGSREKTEEVSATLSKDLRNKLTKPKDKNEIEFARGVVGRFSSGLGYGEFKKYGTLGMDTLKSAMGDIIKFIQNPNKSETIREIEFKSYQRLEELYGHYFTGKR